MLNEIKNKVRDKFSLRFWQVIGTLGIILAYVLFVLKQARLGWMVSVIVIGIPELIAIYIYRGTITKFIRNIFGKTIDRIILFALLPLTWWLAGELAAGFFFLGWLNSHFHEHE